MVKESLLQIFPINLFVKGVYHVVKILKGCMGIKIYWSEANFIVSPKENIVFVKLFDTSFGSNILALFTKLQFQGTDAFGSIQVEIFEIYIKGNFLHKGYMDTSLKSRQAVVFGD